MSGIASQALVSIVKQQLRLLLSLAIKAGISKEDIANLLKEVSDDIRAP